MIFSIIFCGESEHECGQNKNQDLFLPRGKNDSFGYLSEAETPTRS